MEKRDKQKKKDETANRKKGIKIRLLSVLFSFFIFLNYFCFSRAQLRSRFWYKRGALHQKRWGIVHHSQKLQDCGASWFLILRDLSLRFFSVFFSSSSEHNCVQARIERHGDTQEGLWRARQRDEEKGSKEDIEEFAFLCCCPFNNPICHIFRN